MLLVETICVGACCARLSKQPAMLEVILHHSFRRKTSRQDLKFYAARRL
jgi:hypothetical protein